MVTTQSLNRGAIRTWCLFLLLCQTVVRAQHMSTYDLPSFSLLLKVNKADKALVVFQDRLQNAIHQHLVDFFAAKVQIPTFGDGVVDEVALRSNLVWKQLTPADINGIVEYEVRGDYDCELTVDFESQEKNAARLSKSIMDLFLIESFQGDNYWHLVHNFLSDETLEGITDVKITVISDGYIAYNGNEDEDSVMYEEDDGWTAAMTAGVIFAAFFFFILIFMWIYICCFVRGTLLFKSFNPYPADDDLSKATCTDLNSSEDSVDFNFESNESRWMDAWAKSVTSIPLREPIKKKKKMRNAARHPAKTHNSHLDSINESAEDDSSVVSMDEGGRREVMQCAKCVPDDCSLASVDEEAKRELEAQERRKGPATQAIVPFQPDSRALVAAAVTTIGGLKPYFNFRKTQPEFNFAESQPQLEVLDEMC